MRRRNLALAGAAFVVVLAMVLGMSRGPAFEAVHWDSLPEGRAFREVFELASVRGNLTSDQLVFVLNGSPINATWLPPGTLTEGQRFYVVAESFDAPHTLEAFWQGKSIWQSTFTGGSGTPVRESSAATPRR